MACSAMTYVLTQLVKFNVENEKQVMNFYTLSFFGCEKKNEGSASEGKISAIKRKYRRVAVLKREVR
jgi:hypothetical protein